MKKVRIVVGLFLICLGLCLFLSNKILNSNLSKDEDIKLDNTLGEMISYKYVDSSNKYHSILSIPKIKLKRGIYDIGDINNNIDSNILIDKNSVYPNNYPSNVILIAHSGIGRPAYFNRLKELDEDSIVEYYYEHTKYVYKIDHYYYVEKDGKVNLDYDRSKKTITLITCSDDNKQLVYVGYLIDEVTS